MVELILLAEGCRFWEHQKRARGSGSLSDRGRILWKLETGMRVGDIALEDLLALAQLAKPREFRSNRMVVTVVIVVARWMDRKANGAH